MSEAFDLAIGELTALETRIETLKEVFRKTASTEFSKATAALFAEHPALTSVSWRQYTPYFNDGDECTFGVQRDYLDLVFADGTETEYNEYVSWGTKNRVVNIHEGATQEQRDAAAAAHKLLAAMPQDLFKDVFGDHVRVTLTASGASTSRYDHD